MRKGLRTEFNEKPENERIVVRENREIHFVHNVSTALSMVEK
jgi:hypothetical protein